MLIIMASLAQQESQSLSQNVKLELQYRYQQGKEQINHNRFLGYTKDKDGNLAIDPEQAEVVKRIYREYLEGLSMDKVATGLEKNGIRAPLIKSYGMKNISVMHFFKRHTPLTFSPKNELKTTALCHNIM